MTCTIARPDPQELFDHLKNMFSSTVLGGGKVYPESNEWYVVTNDYAAAEQYYAIADQMWRETNPETACCENLYKMAAQHGVFPHPPTHAQGYAKLTGAVGAAVPPSFEIQTDIGTFVSVGTIPLTIPNTGSIIVQIRSLVPGSQYNATGNVTEGVLTTPAPGIDTAVQICGGQFCGGAEEESCEEFRKRYLERLAYQPRATMAWIKQKLMEFPCATRVCVREGACCRCNAECGDCGCKNCGNQMQFYVLFDSVFPCGIPPQNLVDDITDWLFGDPQGYGEGQVEIGVCGKIYAPVPLPVNVIIDIAGCPSTAQKQMINNYIQELFLRICPSMPLTTKQLELIIANVIGPQVNASVRFEIVGYEDQKPPYPRDLVFMDHCGLEPECDVLPCLNEIIYTGPEFDEAAMLADPDFDIPLERYTADGCQLWVEPEETGCCPPPLCGNDLCCTFVAFMNLLPSGPLWDYWKAAAISYFESNPEHPELCPLLQDPQCPSLVLHSIYTVLKLRHVVHGALWPALRESNPYTAVTTLDNHLARLQWEDCYAQHCRSVLLGEMTPLEVWTECGPLFCPPDYPPELEDAVKKGIAIALNRANMGVIKNLCGLNWVIELLGAEVKPVYPPPKPAHPIAPEECASQCAEDVAFEICQTRDWLEGVGSGDICETQMPLPKIPAYWDRGCDRPAGLPDRVWPGVLAAECIVRSMMPPTCPSNISRCC